MGVAGWAVAVLPGRNPASATALAAQAAASSDLGRLRFVSMSQGPPLTGSVLQAPVPGRAREGGRLTSPLLTESFCGGRYAVSGHDGTPVTERLSLRDRGMSGFGCRVPGEAGRIRAR